MNWRELTPYLCLGWLALFVVGLHVSLFMSPRERHERAEVIGKVLSGNKDSSRKQEADLDELHRRVEELEKKHNSGFENSTDEGM